jgi:hypothetical protein
VVAFSGGHEPGRPASAAPGGHHQRTASHMSAASATGAQGCIRVYRVLGLYFRVFRVLEHGGSPTAPHSLAGGQGVRDMASYGLRDMALIHRYAMVEGASRRRISGMYPLWGGAGPMTRGVRKAMAPSVETHRQGRLGATLARQYLALCCGPDLACPVWCPGAGGRPAGHARAPSTVVGEPAAMGPLTSRAPLNSRVAPQQHPAAGWGAGPGGAEAGAAWGGAGGGGGGPPRMAVLLKEAVLLNNLIVIMVKVCCTPAACWRPPSLYLCLPGAPSYLCHFSLTVPAGAPLLTCARQQSVQGTVGAGVQHVCRAHSWRCPEWCP